MALSKSTRIKILLGIDSVFFLVELIVGYAVHSLALVADSFHMLNDVLSLCVGLWAVGVANSNTNSKMYTYGWQRAETLGALINGVFLVALCVSIFLEAIQRFVEPQEVTQPVLILIVGCLGLASNIIGLFLFHDHGHAHGGGGHSHGHGHGQEHTHDTVRNAEEGHAHPDDAQAADESGNIADVLPESRIASWPKAAAGKTAAKSPSDESSTTAVEDNGKGPSKTGSAYRQHKHKKSRSRSRTYSSVEDMPVNPSSFRKSIIDASRMENIDSDEATDDDTAEGQGNGKSSVDQPLLSNGQNVVYGTTPSKPKLISHHSHKHAQPKEAGAKGGHGHSHGDLNMRGVFLHVMGDALGNIGVIAAALFIWLTPWSWRFYFDPAISLIITVIILCSAIPLCKAASRILLQAVPPGLSVDDIKEDIEDLPGIVSCHHLHVWQLSDTKLIASLHVQVAFDFKGEGSARYMELAHAVRDCLHEYGIHSSTIQPEFCLDPAHDHSDGTDAQDGPSGSSPQVKVNAKTSSKATSLHDEENECLLECGDACGDDTSCCPPNDTKASSQHEGHDHSH